MPTDEMVGHYEELRTQVLAGAGRGLGLNVFLQQGLCAWMEARRHCWLTAERQNPRASSIRRSEIPTPAELTILLAGLALNTYEEERRHDA
jgi:hypothetical protein